MYIVKKKKPFLKKSKNGYAFGCVKKLDNCDLCDLIYVEDQFVNPMQQIDRRYVDIIVSKHKILFGGTTNSYSIAVNFDNCIICVPEYHEYAVKKIHEKDDKGCAHIIAPNMKYFCFYIG